MTSQVLRLYPLPSQEVSAIYEDLELPPPGRRDDARPYVVINMVSSVDGKATTEGKASRIGSQTDRDTMRTLRSKADAVMIGAGTLRAESLSLGLDEPSHEPLAVIVTKTGDVPLEENLIRSQRQEVLLTAISEDIPKRLGERVRPLWVPATPSGDVDLEETLKTLRADHSVDLLLVEGGPSLNHALISANLADELFLTLAPKLLGGTGEETLTILRGPVLRATDTELLSAHLRGDELFLRYSLR